MTPDDVYIWFTRLSLSISRIVIASMLHPLRFAKRLVFRETVLCYWLEIETRKFQQVRSIESINELKLLLWKPESSVSCPWFRAICGYSDPGFIKFDNPKLSYTTEFDFHTGWLSSCCFCPLLRGCFPVNGMDLYSSLWRFIIFFMVLTALNRRLLKPVSGLLKCFGSFGALTLRNIFSGIRN